MKTVTVDFQKSMLLLSKGIYNYWGFLMLTRKTISEGKKKARIILFLEGMS